MELSMFVSLYLPLFLALYLITQNLFHKLRNLPPGPFLTFPVVGNIYLLQKPTHITFHRLSKKYGPVFSMQLGSRFAIIVNSPSTVAECLSKGNDAVFANRPRLLAGKHFGYNFTGLAWAPHGDHWRNLRRISSIELLSSHRIQSLSQIRMDEVRILIRHLFKVSSEKPGTVTETRVLIFEMLFNVLTRMIFGKRYYGKNEVNSVEANQFQDILGQIPRVMSKSGLADLFPFVRWFSDAERNMKAVNETRDKFLQDLIIGIRMRGDNRRSADEKGKTMIEVLLSLQETEPEYYTDDVVKSLTAIRLQAGSNTSVSTMEWAMTLLLKHPQVLRSVQNEINNQVEHDHFINDSDLSKLPYLNCVIKETLRFCPVAPLLLPHESSEDCTVQGFHVPRGTMLLVNVWAVQNDPEVWDDPEMFKPERFMTKEGVVMQEEFKHMPFGNGRRKCPGEALAMRMIGLALGSLIQCFDWQRLSEELEDLTEHNGIGIVTTKAKPLMVECSSRTSMVSLLSQI